MIQFSKKNIILVFLLFLLCLPLFQEKFIFANEKPLKGDFVLAEKPDSMIQNWFSGKFQLQYEKYFNDFIGFRNFFVRVNNQINFSLFNQSSVKRLTIGKESYLYETDYITAYYGNNFIGYKNVKNTVHKLKAIQDTLSKLNKKIIVVLAAGKASYYPEYIPDELKTTKKITNNECFSKLMNINKVNYIDFNQWFVKLKPTSKYQLFPKTGTHWTSYGLTLAGDSMIHYIENSCKTDLPELNWNKIETSSSLRDDDDDVEKAMNLLFKIPNTELAYPQFEFKNLQKKKLNSIVIADSYFMRLFLNGFSSNLFNRAKFWYYNKIVYPDNYKKPTEVSSLNLETEINSTDLFIILTTECNISNIGWGAIENIYDYFYKKKSIDNSPLGKKIDEITQQIRGNKEWLTYISGKANQNNISLDSMIYLDARFMATKELEKTTNK